MSNPDDTQPDGDAPDTFENRLAAITRLIDTADEEATDDRRRRRRMLILILLTRLSRDFDRSVLAQLNRLDP